MSRIPFPEHAWPLLKRALEHIAEHPDELYMREWFLTADEEWPYIRRRVEERTGLPFPACGTVACLAGHICIADGAVAGVDVISGDSALTRLGIGVGVGDVRMDLEDIFEMTHITTYAELARELESRFTFPEPLPAVPAVTP